MLNVTFEDMMLQILKKKNEYRLEKYKNFIFIKLL